MAFSVTFNGVSIPSFVKVRAVDFAVLPDISHSFRQIVGGIGLRETGTSIGGKKLKMKIIIVPTVGKSLTEMSRELAYWLRGNDFKSSPLVISDDSTMTYQAKSNTAVDISDLIYVGEGELEFIVPSGTVKSSTTVPVSVVTASSKFTITYNGTAPTYPVINWTPSANLTNVTVNFTCTETGATVSLTGNFTSGQKITIDCEKKVVLRANVVDMKLINYSSNWIKIPSRGTYNITWSQAGTYTCSCTENWL